MSDYEKLKEQLDYLSEHAIGYECIDEKKKNLAIVRLACMQRNKAFQADCEALRKLKKTGHPDMKKREEEFFAKWDIDRQGISLKREKSVQIMSKDIRGYMTLKIDLLQPKGRLLPRIKALIETVQSEYGEVAQEEDFEYQLKHSLVPKEGMNPEEQFKAEMKGINARKSEAKDKKQLRDIDLYRRYLQIWDLRKAGKSWSEIKAILNESKSPLATLEGIRNAYKAIDSIIEKGVPGFTRFPK